MDTGPRNEVGNGGDGEDILGSSRCSRNRRAASVPGRCGELDSSARCPALGHAVKTILRLSRSAGTGSASRKPWMSARALLAPTGIDLKDVAGKIKKGVKKASSFRKGRKSPSLA